MLLDGFDSDGGGEWPPDAEERYKRIEELGRGSYGVVWMGRRKVPPEDEYDDEYVALKNIEIKQQKSCVYASREISILRELRHPCIIRLIRAYPTWEESSQLVVMQLARGPNLQYLVTNRGALGFPLARLVARHLVAAVSYLHGRAVIHRDIKPTNCILCLESTTHSRPDKGYNWLEDDLIWSDGSEAEDAVASNKWKLMLVDFGFARALDLAELGHDKPHPRKSIVNESMCIEDIAKIAAKELQDEKEIEKVTTVLRHDVEETSPVPGKKRLSMVSVNLQDLGYLSDESSDNASSSEQEMSPVPATPERATKSNAKTPESIPEASESPPTENDSSHGRNLRESLGRQSSARTKIRAMSALGTKAYAAPEIKHDLRNKTEDDINTSREALTECVADYGMIADSYSVGWTLRVVLTGVPPNQTVSSYMEKMSSEMNPNRSICCGCFGSEPPSDPPQLRDTAEIPKEAAHLINALTKRNVDERMTVREAQSHPYIEGLPNEKPYTLPVGDIPAKHGDPVVPLKCSITLK